MLKAYALLTRAAGPFLRILLRRRARRGKENPVRLSERTGNPSRPRPEGPLVWLHAASVGEAQSALVLIAALLSANPALHILVTTGTVTSADLMARRLPPRALHQYYPLDHPAWAARFLDHWRPDAALWLESELWPNMLRALKKRDIPAALINARLSERSAARWRKASASIRTLLESFAIILCQTPGDATIFESLGGRHVQATGNLKYAAAPLPCDKQDYDILAERIKDRPVWLYASTHAGEEDIACRLHAHLQKTFPTLLTIIVPRHPERRAAIQAMCSEHNLCAALRTETRLLPTPDTEIYIVDTLGELGLFYRLAPLACIGRSFSRDGGGGHNPLEAAQLGCAVLHGPHIQNLQAIYDEMDSAGAALLIKNEEDFEKRLEKLLQDEEGLAALQERGLRFARAKADGLIDVLAALAPLWEPLLPHQEPRNFSV
ncbi:MAG: 3-deoxy-D-manno-octulosonic acid transferase [Alphaproteobacteria bacterium]|nr:3-deoxy-D-manno-octulosonic acid transferase [Alphaproteobacteria bacterium]